MSLSNWLWDIQGAAILGVIWGIMALGLYLTYRVLNYADLTVDGSLALGGAISAVYVAAGVQPMIAILLATLGGMIAGFVTGFLHTKLNIPDLLAGILTQFALYSINLRIMGKANYGLLNVETLFSQVKALGVPNKWTGLVVGLIFVIILIILIYCFFGTEIGCALRATGNNPDMVKAMGGNTKTYIVLGLVVGNGLVAMSGGLLAQYIGRVFQDPLRGTAGDMWIEENLAMALRRGKRRSFKWGISNKEREQFVELLKTLDLGLESRLSSKVGLLSGGQRQALTLLMATIKKPQLLLLDEHTAALDPKTAKKVLDITNKVVTENNLTTIMITHNMKDAIKYGNRLVMMNNGSIIYDVSGQEKQSLQVSDLLAKFEQHSDGEFANDRMMLAH